jgi:hypothetical protein
MESRHTLCPQPAAERPSWFGTALEAARQDGLVGREFGLVALGLAAYTAGRRWIEVRP